MEKINIHHTEVNQFFYNKLGQKSCVPSDLVSGSFDIDSDAVFSVLQLGAIVPPLSPWKDVYRYIPGYVYEGTNPVFSSQIDLIKYSNFNSLETQSDCLSEIIDNILLTSLGNNNDPVVLFSGGVDSGYIAARLAKLGMKDTLLLNFSFGVDDKESYLAESMAKHLGLKFQRVYMSNKATDCLMRPGSVYALPFSDSSTPSTVSLASSVSDFLKNDKRLIIDGTGADGAFGMNKKISILSLINKTPYFLKKISSNIYVNSMWQTKTRYEKFFRIMHRLCTMPFLSAALVQNPLANILYNESSKEKVHTLLSNWIDSFAFQPDLNRVVMGDLMLTCANIFAQKARPIYDNSGLKVLFPFLHQDVLSASMAFIKNSHWANPKSQLKISLARQVPSEMVYRQKSGFVDPSKSIFFDKLFIEFLRESISLSGPILSYLKKDNILKVCDLLNKKINFPDQTLNCFWAIVFLDRWYRTSKIR